MDVVEACVQFLNVIRGETLLFGSV
eukprot:SAG31_NODE_10961_length_1078_cov_1.621042_1_plen_24_part_01